METFVATPLYQLVETRLGSSPLAFIEQRRRGPEPVAYRKIALELSDQTNTDVTQEAVRRWWLAELRTRDQRDATVKAELDAVTEDSNVPEKHPV